MRVAWYRDAMWDAEEIEGKIESMFVAARRGRRDVLVLSAFGCGAFANPPSHVAQIFRRVLERSFGNAFRHIVFAIVEDHNSKKAHNSQGNVLPFEAIFGDLLPSPETSGSEQVTSGSASQSAR
jgi:hypothetical protein